MSTIDEIMSEAQVFASAWSLVGGRFDDGSGLEHAEECKAAMRDLIAAALADAYRSGAESMRAEAMDCAVNAGRGSLAEEIAAIPAPSPGALPLPTGERQAVLLTDEQIEHGRKQIFSTNNPFCPCDAKTMCKAARWAEAAALAANGLEVRRG